jgi:hypothetical protein
VEALITMIFSPSGPKAHRAFGSAFPPQRPQFKASFLNIRPHVNHGDFQASAEYRCLMYGDSRNTRSLTVFEICRFVSALVPPANHKILPAVCQGAALIHNTSKQTAVTLPLVRLPSHPERDA